MLDLYDSLRRCRAGLELIAAQLQETELQGSVSKTSLCHVLDLLQLELERQVARVEKREIQPD